MIGHVEGAAAEVVDEVGGVAVVLEPGVVDGGGGRLVQQLDDLVAGQLAGLARGLDLVVVEVGRHGDDGASRAGSAGRRGCGAIQSRRLAQDDGGHLRRASAPRGRASKASVQAHVALDGRQRQRGAGRGWRRAPARAGRRRGVRWRRRSRRAEGKVTRPCSSWPVSRVAPVASSRAMTLLVVPRSMPTVLRMREAVAACSMGSLARGTPGHAARAGLPDAGS